MLAAEAQDRGACNIRMMNVTSQQTTKIPGVLVRSAASGLVQKKLDAVDVLKNPGGSARSLRLTERGFMELVRLPFAIQPRQLRNLTPVNLRRCKAEFLFKRLFQNSQIAVFAEDERKNEPVIPRTHLSVISVISEKCFARPFGNVWRSPVRTGSLRFLKRRSRMSNVASGK